MSRWPCLTAALLATALAACAGGPPTSPPETTARGPGGTARLSRGSEATFQLTGSQGTVGFRCALDGAPVACAGGVVTVSGLTDGPHTFTAAAIDAGGVVDPTPAVWAWTVDPAAAPPPAFTVVAGVDSLTVTYPAPGAGQLIEVTFGPVPASPGGPAPTFVVHPAVSPVTLTSDSTTATSGWVEVRSCQEYWVTVATVDAGGNIGDAAPVQYAVTGPPASPRVDVYGKDGTIVIGAPLEGVQYLVEYGTSAERLDGTEATEGPSPITVAAGAALHGFPATEPRWFRVSQRSGTTCPAVADPVVRATPRPWRPLNAGPTAALLTSAACASATSCVVAGTGGEAFFTADGATWARTRWTTDTVRMVRAAPSAFFALGYDGLLYRSVDGGATWGLRGSVDAADLAFASADVGYAAGGSGLYRTVDGGLNWEHRSVRTSFAVAAVPGGRRAVAVTPEGDALVSTDGGTTWTVRPATSEPLTSVACPTATRCLAAGGSGTFVVSDDAGDAWSTRPWGLTDGIAAMAFGDAAHGLAHVTGAAADALYRTADGGGSWQLVPMEPIEGLASAGPSSGLVVGTAGLLARTDDGGATWAQVGDRQLVPGTYGVLRVVAPGTVVAAGSAGARRSVDGGLTWAAVAYPATVEWALQRTLAFSGETFGLMAAVERGTGAYRFLRTFDGGATWSLDGSGAVPGRVLDLSCLAGASPASTICHAVAGQEPSRALYRTTDGGATWALHSAEGDDVLAVRFLDELHGLVTRMGPSALPGGPLVGRTYATADGGTTWSLVEAIRAGQLEAVPPSMVVVGGELSLDGGATWAAWSPRSPYSEAYAIGAGVLVEYDTNTFWEVSPGVGVSSARQGAFPWEGPMVSLAPLTADRWLALDLNGVVWVTETGGR